MRKQPHLRQISISLLLLVIFFSCKERANVPAIETINAIKLKRGDVVVCGPEEKQFGAVGFRIEGSKEVQQEFDLGVALLHSFEYDEAEKVFAKVIDMDPGCAMAYWGVAMSNYHPLWAPPTAAELEKGAKAVAIAKSISKKSKYESAYINAIAQFYDDRENVDHRTRAQRFQKSMEQLYTDFPNEKEAAIFYSLALTATADPTDKTFKNQKKAGEILNALYPGQPNHPGVVHYIIHTYDNPELAQFALPAARKYASVAPSSAHALHMPSHVFTRLGLWDECINSNIASVSSAQCYASAAGIKGHWDEELHGLDYLTYAYLQKGDNKRAKQQVDYLKSINEVQPFNFKVAYAFASIPSRYVLENRLWNEAANLQSHKANIPWTNFPWQKAIIHFTRLMGNVNIGKLDSAKSELRHLEEIHEGFVKQKDPYNINQLQIQLNAGKAWILFKEGQNEEAIRLMTMAADKEDATDKLPVTPGEIIPARELLGDMLLQMGKTGQALQAYEADLKKQLNRFNGLYGAARAAELSNNPDKAILYYQQLVTIAGPGSQDRPELEKARQYLRSFNNKL
ncbi:MAG TPA: hypothetical protein VFZ42_08685 [Chitinophagaceae bacterium]